MHNDLEQPEMQMFLRVAVINDYPVVRRGMISLLNDAGFDAADIKEYELSSAAEQISHQHWDLILLGVPRTAAGWLPLIRQMANGHAVSHLLVLSELDEQKHEIAALRAGAGGYLHMSSSPETISTAIKKVLEGGSFVSRDLVHVLVGQLNHQRSKNPADTLSDRENQVLRGLVAGKTTKELAYEMHLSAKTVSTYRARICTKLNVQSNAGLVRYALKHKLTS